MAVLVYFCLKNMKAEFVLYQFMAKSQVFWSGQNYFELDKRQRKFLTHLGNYGHSASARNACFWTQHRQQHKKPLTVTSL